MGPLGLVNQLLQLGFVEVDLALGVRGLGEKGSGWMGQFEGKKKPARRVVGGWVARLERKEYSQQTNKIGGENE